MAEGATVAASLSSSHMSFAGLSFNITFTTYSLMPKPMLIKIPTVAPARREG